MEPQQILINQACLIATLRGAAYPDVLRVLVSDLAADADEQGILYTGAMLAEVALDLIQDA